MVQTCWQLSAWDSRLPKWHQLECFEEALLPKNSSLQHANDNAQHATQQNQHPFILLKRWVQHTLKLIWRQISEPHRECVLYLQSMIYKLQKWEE